MGIRKEQVLALLALATAVLAGRKYFDEAPPGASYRPGKLEFTANAVAPTPLVTEGASAASRRDFCTEPSETRPLPPRDLAFPPRAPLSLAALPLDPGPDLGHAWMLTTDGAQVEGVTLQTAADAGSAAAETPAQPQEQEQPQGTKEKEERAALLYDRIWIEGQSNPHFGLIETEGVDLFELEKKDGQLDGVVLRQREFRLSTQKVGQLNEFGKEKQKITRIRLAGTLRNEITRRIRAVPPGPSPTQRHELVSWLLEKARGDASICSWRRAASTGCGCNKRCCARAATWRPSSRCSTACRATSANRRSATRVSACSKRACVFTRLQNRTCGAPWRSGRPMRGRMQRWPGSCASAVAAPMPSKRRCAPSRRSAACSTPRSRCASCARSWRATSRWVIWTRRAPR
jgi:hypothetical protein